MSVFQFEKQQGLVIFDNGDNPKIAQFDTTTGELQYITLFMYAQGQPTGSIRLNLYSAVDQPNPIASSDYVAASEVVSQTTNKIFWQRFDFGRPSLSENSTYVIGIETVGYTRNGDVDYLSYCQQQVDSPNVNVNSASFDRYSRPAAFKIYPRA